MFAANHAIITFHSNLKLPEFQKPHFLLFPFTFVSYVFICAELLGSAYGFVRTAWIGLRTYQSAWYPVHHDALWQVHGVGNGQDHKPGILVSGPVKEIVHYVLFLSPEKVELPGKWREMQHKSEMEPGPRRKPLTTALAACASQVTPQKWQRSQRTYALPPENGLRWIKKGDRTTSLLPSICSQNIPIKNHATSSLFLL